MNRTMEVCLAGLMLVAGVVAANEAAAQTLQKGISVEMAVTRNAVPTPEADNADAWIVAVVRDGALYFGTDKVTFAGLAEAMKSRPRNREQKLYIKADARAPFTDVENAMEAGRAASFEAVVLLTSQPEPAAPGKVVPPKGLEVLVTPPPGAESIVVQVSNYAGQARPRLLVDNADVASDVFPSTLGRMLGRMRQNKSEAWVVVKAAGTVPFQQVAHVIDVCRGVGAQVVLPVLRNR